MQVNLDPARGTCDILSMVLCSPSLHKAESNRAHLGEFVHGLESLVHRVCQQVGKLLVVEYLQAALGRDLADGGRMERVRVVALSTLNKDGVVAETLGKDLSAHVEDVDTLSDVAADVLDGRVAIHVGE